MRETHAIRKKTMGVSNRGRHRLAVPPRSVIGSPSGENRIHGIQAASQREMKLRARQHGYSQVISEAGHVQNSIYKLTDVNCLAG